MTDKPKLNTVLSQLAKRECKEVLGELSGLQSVVVATVDGFDVASAMHTGDAARVAAMASSIAAISHVVSQEAKLGRNKNVTIVTDAGFAGVWSVSRSDHPLVIIAIAKGDAILAQVSYRMSNFARTLTEA